MSLELYLDRFQKNENQWAVRKDWLYDQADLLRSFGQIAGETEHEWLIPCWHLLNPPASLDEINEAQSRLGYEFPAELVHFLRLANGARLYCLTPLWLLDTFPDAQYQRYKILSVDELVNVNRKMFDVFRHFSRLDPAYEMLHSLNYVAFCDAHDGNYLAILREGHEKGKVFFLDHEYEFFPYGDSTFEAYYTVAESLEAWLELIVNTKGWGGFGERPPPL